MAVAGRKQTYINIAFKVWRNISDLFEVEVKLLSVPRNLAELLLHLFSMIASVACKFRTRRKVHLC